MAQWSTTIPIGISHDFLGRGRVVLALEPLGSGWALVGSVSTGLRRWLPQAGGAFACSGHQLTSGRASFVSECLAGAGNDGANKIPSSLSGAGNRSGRYSPW